MQMTCPECGYFKEATYIPVDGIMAECPKCRFRFRVLQLPQLKPASETVHFATLTDALPALETADHDCDDCNMTEGDEKITNFLTLLMLIDATCSLIILLSEVFHAVPVLGSLQQAKYLYDTLMAVGFFICALGLFARKEWGDLRGHS
jgi:hypothetical protein